MKRACGILALLTDFGNVDPYVAAMKGAALSACEELTLVDITHEVPSFDVDYGSFVLLASYKYFPAGTVFVAVVDPGVGSSRRPIAIATRNYYFVGPDNGILVPAALEDGIELAVVLNREELFRRPVSPSFHGRDIFVPVAARIACGVEVASVGDLIDVNSLVRPSLRFGSEVRGECIKTWVIHVDKFGNVLLSERFSKISSALEVGMGGMVDVRTKGRDAVAVVERVFSLAPRGTLVLYEDSFGYGELALNMGSAEEVLKVSRGDEVLLCKHGIRA